MHIFCLKNKAFYLLTLIAFMLVSANFFLFPRISEADERFISTELELEILAPFERMQSSSAIVVLRNKTQGFPTFNAVLSPSAWPYSSLKIEQQGLKLIDEYKLVGLKSSELKSIQILTLGGRNSLLAEIGYKIGNEQFTSQVWIVPGSDRHLILTAVYKEQGSAIDRELIAKLLQGLSIKMPQANDFMQVNEQSAKFPLSRIVALLVLVVVSILAIKLISKRKKL